MAHLTRIKTSAYLNTRRPVLGLLEGAYASRVTGRGGDFHDLREYVPGDDVRDLDWKATARRGEPLVRRYVAERRHTVMFLVRAGRHLAAHANPTDTKREIAVTVTGMLGWLALRHGDYVGALIGHGELTAHRPVLTEVGLERLLGDLDAQCTPEAPEQQLAPLLEQAVGLVKRRSFLVVVTDTAELTELDQRLLRRLQSQHEVLLVAVGDLNPAHQTSLPLVDIDRGRQLPDFLSGVALAREVTRLDARRRGTRERVLAETGIPSVQVDRLDEAAAAVFWLLRRTRRAR